MKWLLFTLMTVVSMNIDTLFDFHPNADIRNWRITDDQVMGGVSSSSFQLNSEGIGLFKGRVSLDNNGGFCSVRYQFERFDLKEHTHIILRVKGDGKRYQFRVKANSSDYHSYISYFETSGEWQEIELALEDLYPTFRGRKLYWENFAHSYLEEVAFLIGNKKEEAFELLVDKITLR